jgi:hypothetical protein
MSASVYKSVIPQEISAVDCPVSVGDFAKRKAFPGEKPLYED